MFSRDFSNIPSAPTAPDDTFSLNYIGQLEFIPAPRERSFLEILLGIPDTGSALMKAAQCEAMLDQYRAALTASAIQHTAIFAAMESQLAMLSPRGAARVAALADAYTARAIQAIGGRWIK